MATLYKNNASATLAANIGPSDTLLLLSSGQGAMFPSPSAGDGFYMTLVHEATAAVEIVYCVSRASDTLTVIRGREGTNAVSFTTGSIAEMRLTAGMLEELSWQNSAGVPSGVLQLDATGMIPDAKLSPNIPRLNGTVLKMENIPSEVARTADVDTKLATKASLSSSSSVFTGTVTALSGLIAAGSGNGGFVQVGDDAKLVDIGVPNTVGVVGMSDATIGYIRFGSGAASLGWNGTNLGINGNEILHRGNLDTTGFMLKAGGTFSGLVEFTTGARIRRDVNPAHGYLQFGSGGSSILLDDTGWTFLGGKTVYATDFFSTSDARQKKSLKLMRVPGGLADRITIKSWTWRETGVPGAGVVAQEVQQYAPHRVFGRADGTLSVDKAGLALDGIADLSARIRRLEKSFLCNPTSPKKSSKQRSRSSAGSISKA